MKIALVTGGSRGLGKNAALALAQQGMAVVITYNSNNVAASEVVDAIAATGGEAAAIQLDVGQTTRFTTFAETLRNTLRTRWDRDQFDVLLNNAGFGVHAGVAETTEEAFDALLGVHFKGVFFLTQALLPMLADGGRIINISTGLTRFALPGYAAYAAMKGAVEVFTRYLAKELGPRGIAANIVAPGAIETDFGGGAVRDNAQVNAFVASQTALGRAGMPEDIGGVIAFLCSPQGRWVNGQRLEVSGGMFL